MSGARRGLPGRASLFPSACDGRAIGSGRRGFPWREGGADGLAGLAQLDALHERPDAVDQVVQAEQQRQGDRADTRAPRMNSARAPVGSPAAKAAPISTTPAMTAQVPTISTSTRAVGPGQARATTPAARFTRPRSRCPNTGPAPGLLNARMAS